MKYIYFSFLTLICFKHFGQSPGDYRTKSTASGGTWTSTVVWETYNGSTWVATTTPPNNTNGVITITSPVNFTISDNESITADQIVIEAGALLTLAGHLSLTNGPGDDLIVNGQVGQFDGGLFNSPTNAGNTLLINAGGIYTFYGQSNLFRVNTTNNGTIELVEGKVTFYENCTITNNGVANLLAIRSNIGINGGFYTSINEDANFINNGTINTTTTSGRCNFGFTNFTNNGNINVNGFTEITNNATNDDNFTFINNSTITLTNGGLGQLFLYNNSIFNAGTTILGSNVLTNRGIFTLNTDIDLSLSNTNLDNEGEVNGNGNLSLGSTSPFPITGKFNGAGNLVLKSNFTWSTTDPLNSNIGNRTIEITAGKTLTLSGTNPHEIWGNINNNGTINWTQGDILSKSSAIFTNNGTFNLNGLNWNSDALPIETVLNNTGILLRSVDAPLPLHFKLNNNSTGLVNIADGSLEFNRVVNNEGSIQIGLLGVNPNGFVANDNFNLLATGSINTTDNCFITNNLLLNLVASLNLGATVNFQNTGNIIGAGNLTLNQDFSLDGSISGAGTFVVNGNLTWNSGILARNFTNNASRTFTFNNLSTNTLAANLINNGTMIWANGNINFATNKLITNNSVFNITSDKIMQDGLGIGGFDNFGTIFKSTTGQTDFIQNTFANRPAGIIKGTGIFNFNNTIGINAGKIEPGASPGIITINGNQPLTANCTLNIEINNTAGAGVGHDQLKRDGNLTLAGTLNVLEASNLPNGTFEIIHLNSGAISGSFSTTQLPAGYITQQTSSSFSLIKNVPTICIATSSGNWNNPSIWDCNQVPDETKAVVIGTGITVTIPNAFVAKAKNLTNNGNLSFETSGQFILNQ